MITPGTKLKLADDVTFQSMGSGEQTVILSLSSGYFYTCNETTAAFLESLDGDRTFEQAVEIVLGQFEVSRDKLQTDLAAIAAKLADEKLIVADNAS